MQKKTKRTIDLLILVFIALVPTLLISAEQINYAHIEEDETASFAAH